MFLLIKGKQPGFLKPVILYLLIALFLNLIADIIGDFKNFNEDYNFTTGKDFWVVTGLSLYVVTNFLFSFYVQMIKDSPTSADRMWDIHDSVLIVFCILLTIAFYQLYSIRAK